MKKWTVYVLLALCLIGCAGHGKAGEPGELVVMTHDSFDIGTEVVAAFEAQHNAKVTFLKSGDTGEVLNKAILSKDNPLADVLYGVDNTFLSRALDNDLFDAYKSPALANVDPSLILDPKSGLLSNYYYQRGRGILWRRVVDPERVFEHPLDWPAAEAVAIGSRIALDSGNANATVIGDSHYVSFYSGQAPDTAVLASELPAPTTGKLPVRAVRRGGAQAF